MSGPAFAKGAIHDIERIANRAVFLIGIDEEIKREPGFTDIGDRAHIVDSLTHRDTLTHPVDMAMERNMIAGPIDTSRDTKF
jgi:hypothetical protein